MGVILPFRRDRPDEIPGEPAAATVPWYRRRRVHVALGVIVAVLTTLLAGQRAAEGVRSNLDARLLDAGAGVDAGFVALEAEQLSALRAVTFTQGVATALGHMDVKALNALVTPIQANSDVPMVDVVLPDGRVALAVRSKGAPRPVASRRGLPALTQALHSAGGVRGGRFSEVVFLRSGPTFLTAGPVLSGTTVVGAVLVMTPLADALGRFSQEVHATLTAYDGNGTPVATTASYTPGRISRTPARGLIGGAPVMLRSAPGGRREALGRLIVDHQPDALLGVALPDNSWSIGRAVLLYVGLGLLCTILIVGSFAIRFPLPGVESE